MRKIDCLEKRE